MTIRIEALLQIVILLFLSGVGSVAAAELDRSRCHEVPAHDTVEVTGAGAYANPPERAGWPSQPGCQIAYVVDFVSREKRMSSFVPDRDWVKGSISLTSCVGECGGVEYIRYRAGIDVYHCTSKRDCASDRYSKVGSYAVRYGKAILPPRCAPLLLAGYSVPTVRDSHGVRLVIKYEVVNYEDLGGAQCVKTPLPLPPGLDFNASGTAGFPTLGPLDDSSRPKAEPLPSP